MIFVFRHVSGITCKKSAQKKEFQLQSNHMSLKPDNILSTANTERKKQGQRLTRAGPTPTNISKNSEPLTVINGTLASPAVALARSVFPVPGGPVRIAPCKRNVYFLHEEN